MAYPKKEKKKVMIGFGICIIKGYDNEKKV